MALRLLLVLIATLVNSIITLSACCIMGTVGYDLLYSMDQLCALYQPVIFFDVYFDVDGKHIAVFHEKLQGLNSFKDRVVFDPEPCTITVKNVSMEDDKKLPSIKIKIKYDDHGVIKLIERTFNASITDNEKLQMAASKIETPDKDTRNGAGRPDLLVCLTVLFACLLMSCPCCNLN